MSGRGGREGSNEKEEIAGCHCPAVAVLIFGIGFHLDEGKMTRS